MIWTKGFFLFLLLFLLLFSLLSGLLLLDYRRNYRWDDRLFLFFLLFLDWLTFLFPNLLILFLFLTLNHNQTRNIIKIIKNSPNLQTRSNIKSIPFQWFSFGSFLRTKLTYRDLVIDLNNMILELTYLPCRISRQNEIKSCVYCYLEADPAVWLCHCCIFIFIINYMYIYVWDRYLSLNIKYITCSNYSMDPSLVLHVEDTN